MNTTRPLIASPALLPETTQLGRVSLVVRDLKNSIAFYTKVLKMTLFKETDTTAILGNTKHILLELTENSNAKQYQKATGLYHFAIIYPDEKELAEAIAWLFTLRYPNSPTDHGYSKTTYLTDPDGTTIELYIRTPDRGVYTIDEGNDMKVIYTDGRIGSGRDPLDMEELFDALTEDSILDAPLSAETAMGHVHLYANDINAMMVFYRDVIGFGEGMMIESFKMGDVSLSEVQFHVLAFNEWKGNVPPPPEVSNGMHHYTVVVSDNEAFTDLDKRIKDAGITTTPHQDGYFIKDPAGLRLYITKDDANMRIVHDTKRA